MCFDHDYRPPITPIAGGALDAREIELAATDGNRFAADIARAAEPTGAFACPVLAVFGEADEGIGPEAADFADTSARAWDPVPGFVRTGAR